MTMLCLIRHGQTDWNLEGRYQGQTDVSLNHKGLAQAESTAQRLQGKTFAALYSSDLKRALQTAEAVGAALHLPIQPEPRLREINQGQWECQLVDVIKARYVDLWQQRSTDPASVRPPGGETVREVAERVHAALDDIARRHPNGFVVIVSHGLALATAICAARGVDAGHAYEFIPDNARPVWAEWQAG